MHAFKLQVTGLQRLGKLDIIVRTILVAVAFIYHQDPVGPII